MKPKMIIGLFIAMFSSFIASSQDSTVIPTPTDTLPNTIEPLTDTVPQAVDTLHLINPADVIEENKNERASQKKKLTLAQLGIANRSKDHLLIQVGMDNWANKPDTLNTKGLSRSFNMYLMFDFPFKTNPHLSVAFGAGIGTSSIYFSGTSIDIAGKLSNKLSFLDVSDTTHFKKYKLMTTYLEAPVEMRYVLNPAHPKKSFKAALGVKIGTMLAATTKGKNLQNSAGNTINAFTQKERTKRYFNSTRLAVTGRVGFGALSLFGTYQVNAFIKEGFGPDVRPFAVGISLSGL